MRTELENAEVRPSSSNCSSSNDDFLKTRVSFLILDPIKASFASYVTFEQTLF